MALPKVPCLVRDTPRDSLGMAGETVFAVEVKVASKVYRLGLNQGILVIGRDRRVGRGAACGCRRGLLRCCPLFCGLADSISPFTDSVSPR